MNDILQFLYLPFLAGLILTGIHAYLGVHVVERGVIFVDLSLAQIAALGSTFAVLRGFDPHGGVTYWWSLGFTIMGAAIFSLTRVHRETRIPQEAIIGIVYAVSAAAAILAMSKATGETEHLKDMLVGNILSVSSQTVIKTAVLYAAVGLFHFIFRKKFLAVSMGEEIPHLKLWDFLFYTSFGFVVTSSVAIAGVLLVFSYLIVPSVAAMLFARTIGKRLAIGWTMGALVSALGVLLSFKLDLPTGATIVCTFGITLALMAAVWAVFVRPKLAA
ncbi:MAG TPA: metal ABC transporter permease [Thermoanaerobaculia bacterium]|nr:metal ABC transporter permease [Thermoanaerobaculia bacterium]